MIKEKLLLEVDERREEIVKLCSDLIKIESVNPPGNTIEVIDYICNYLKDANIEYEIRRAEGGPQNIVAKFGNPNGKRLIFNGHCDVVPIGDEAKWSFPPFSGEVVDGMLQGRGASDMKCGLGAFLFASKLINTAGVQLAGEVLLTIVSDEETGGEYGTEWLFDNGYITGDWGIIAEPTGIDNIEVGQKGTMGMNLIARGKTAHGSLSPYVGDNAIDKLMRFIPHIYKLRELHGEYSGEVEQVMNLSKEICSDVQMAEGVENIMDHVTVGIGTINGGSKRNVVADTAMCELDVRVPIGVHYEDVIAEVDKIIEESGIDGIEATYENPRNPNYISIEDPIVATTLKAIKEIVGIDAMAAYQWASSDTRYFREAGIPTIQYGPSRTEGIHNYDESLPVEDLYTFVKVYLSIILDLLS